MHYRQVHEVNLKHRFEGDGVMRTNAEWEIIHEAFDQMRERKERHKGKPSREPRRVHHHYMQSNPLF